MSNQLSFEPTAGELVRKSREANLVCEKCAEATPEFFAQYIGEMDAESLSVSRFRRICFICHFGEMLDRIPSDMLKEILKNAVGRIDGDSSRS